MRRCWILLTRRSAWPRRKTIVWLARCIENPDRSHVGKSPVSQTTFRQRLEDLILYLESYYEGNSVKEITFPIRLLKRLGVHTIIGPTLQFILPVDFFN